MIFTNKFLTRISNNTKIFKKKVKFNTSSGSYCGPVTTVGPKGQASLVCLTIEQQKN